MELFCMTVMLFSDDWIKLEYLKNVKRTTRGKQKSENDRSSNSKENGQALKLRQ